MLRGPELLAKVKELSSVAKSDVVRSCGYVTPRKDGSQRLNYTAFYEALLEAKGMKFGGAGEGATRRDSAGRKLSYIAKVHFNGNLLVGKAYTALLGLQPGDEFDIKLERKGIRLVPKNRSEDMMSSASAPDAVEESAPPAAYVAPAPAPAPEPTQPSPAVPQSPPVPVVEAPVAPPSTPPAPPVAPVAPAPIPTPVAAPVAPTTAPVAPTAPVASAPPAPASTDTSPQTPLPQSAVPGESWEASLRKLDQSSRPPGVATPEPWDA